MYMYACIYTTNKYTFLIKLIILLSITSVTCLSVQAIRSKGYLFMVITNISVFPPSGHRVQLGFCALFKWSCACFGQ